MGQNGERDLNEQPSEDDDVLLSDAESESTGDRSLEAGAEDENSLAVSFDAGSAQSILAMRGAAFDLSVFGLASDESMLASLFDTPRAGVDPPDDAVAFAEDAGPYIPPAKWPDEIKELNAALVNLAEIPPQFEGSNFAPTDYANQRQAMLMHIEQLPDGPQKQSMLDSIKAIEEKIGSGLSQEEVAATYFHANRLLESKLGEPLDRSDGVRVVQALLAGVAQPADTNQGSIPSCGVTPTREWLLANRPSEAARIAADVMTGDGTYTHVDAAGETYEVKLDLGDWKSDWSAHMSSLNPEAAAQAGLRDQLGQVLDHVMINSVLQKIAPDARYSERNRDGWKLPSTGAGDDWGPFDGLPLGLVKQVAHDFSGLSDRVISHSDFDAGDATEGIQFVDSEAALVAVLEAGLPQGSMQLDVNPAHGAFSTDGDGGFSASRHMLTLKALTTIDGQKYALVSDQRGSVFDSWISTADLFEASAIDADQELTFPTYSGEEGNLVEDKTLDNLVGAQVAERREHAEIRMREERDRFEAELIALAVQRL